MVENTQRSTELGAKGGVQFIHQAYRAFFITDFNLSRVEANAFTNTGFQHLRYQRALLGPFSGEGYMQLQYNKPLRIDAQFMVGAGPRCVVRDADDLRLAVGTSVLYEHEVDRVNRLRYDDVRSSSYLSVGFKVEPQLQLTSVYYFQPRLGDIRDHRMMLEGQVLVRATRRFAMETRLNLQKDTKVAPACRASAPAGRTASSSGGEGPTAPAAHLAAKRISGWAERCEAPATVRWRGPVA